MTTLSLANPDAIAPLTKLPGAPLGDAWFLLPAGPAAGSQVVFKFAAGALRGRAFASLDVLLESSRFITCHVLLAAGDKVLWASQVSPLTQCQVRLVFRLGGVDLGAADRAIFRVIRKTDPACRFCLTPITVGDVEPGRLESPLLPVGPIVDEFGLSTLHDCPTRTRTADAVVANLRKRHAEAGTKKLPDSMNRWGGWKERHVGGTGFFRTHHDGKRWWLVDPDGHLFWSNGLDCTHPTIDHETVYQTRHENLRSALKWMPDPKGEFASAYRTNPYHNPEQLEFNFVQANFIRAFGADRWHDAWGDVAAAELRALGCNTAGDWSDEPQMSRTKTPYVLPLDLPWALPGVERATGAFPDPYAENLPAAAKVYAESLRATANDPAMIGYFLTNEPSVGWQMIDERRGLAEAMLVQTPGCASRRALAAELRKMYGDNAGLASAWKMDVTLEQVAEGAWATSSRPFTAEAHADLTAFSTVMLARLIRILSDACRAVDPNHLNLGIRWWTFPPAWALRSMAECDVVSFNYYQDRVGMLTYGHSVPEPGAPEALQAINRPVLIGEWHFGAMDGGLASAGLCRVGDQHERAKAYRGYVENAAALPWCIGVHWFNLYDRCALSSTSSNENYNIGFFDLAHQPYKPICDAARLANERLYGVASGTLTPYGEFADALYPSR